jgi:hypothetical protein
MPLTVTPRGLLAIIASAVLAIGSAIAVSPAQAAESASFYRVELAQPAAASTVVAGGLAWRCSGSACSAGKSTSRDAIVCAKLVKEVGAVTSFATPKGTLEGDDLARCNKG